MANRVVHSSLLSSPPALPGSSSPRTARRWSCGWPALHLYSAQIRDHILAQHLIHAAVAQRSPAAVPPADAAAPREFLPLSRLNRFQRALHAVDREPQRVRKLLIQQQKLQNPVRRQVRRIHLAVRLECCRRPQQPHPIQIFIALGHACSGCPQGPRDKPPAASRSLKRARCSDPPG